MRSKQTSSLIEICPSRRHILAGTAASLGIMTKLPFALGQPQAQLMQEPPSSAANQGRNSFHQ